jgi:hypothetical protein
MPIYPRYLNALRNKFAGTGLYDDSADDSGFMADAPPPQPTFRRDSMIAAEPPPMLPAQELPPPPAVMPFNDTPSDNPDTDNPMMTAQRPPLPPPGVNGPSLTDLLRERQELRPPDPAKPNKWQVLAAGAIGGLQGLQNARRPQDRPIDLVDAIPGIVRPNVARQQAQFGRKRADLDSRIKTSGDVEQIETNKTYREGIVANRKQADEDRRTNAAKDAEQRLFNAELSVATAGGKMADPNAQPQPDHQRITFGGKAYDVPQKGIVKVRNPDAAAFLGVQVGDPVSAEDHAKALEHAGRMAEITAKPEKESRTPDQREYDQAKAEGFKGTFVDYQKVMANLKTPRTTVVTGGDGMSNATANRVNSIAGQFDGEPVVKNFSTIREAKMFVNDLGNNKNPTDDQALLYAFAKAMDPGSVVREGEYSTVQKYAQTWAQNLGFNAKRVFSNVPFLTDEARRNMKDTIEKKYAAAEKNYRNVYDEYGRRIEKVGGVKNGREYITDYAKDATSAPATPPRGGSVQMKAPNGQVSTVPADQVEHFKSLGAKVVQ